MTDLNVMRKRFCGCGQYKVPLENGTMPQHAKPNDPHVWAAGGPLRVRCEWSGKFPPATAKERQKEGKELPQIMLYKDGKVRGSRRKLKQELGLKRRYRRNKAGGYTR